MQPFFNKVNTAKMKKIKSSIIISNFLLQKYRQFFYKFKHIKLINKIKKIEWKCGTNLQERKRKIIISMTSYPERFVGLDLCLKSLCCQSMLADKIIIWLGSDTNIEQSNLLCKKYGKYGIDIRLDKEKNLFSHKKYFYAMQEFPDDIIITVDDDLVYPYDMIESLYKSYLINPECISARRVHRITWNNCGVPNPYIYWRWEAKSKKTSFNLCATTGAGTLPPPHCMNNECFDITVFMKYAKTADDLWLNVMALISGHKIKWAKNTLPLPAEISEVQKNKLVMENVGLSKNDRVFLDLINLYNLTEYDFKCR